MKNHTAFYFKYFWDLNEEALRETGKILKDPKHPKFIFRMVALLSRCQKPKELFSLISKKEFLTQWPKIRRYWFKISRNSDFRDWWETIYEQILQNSEDIRKKTPREKLDLLIKTGKLIKKARVQKGWSQKELALRIGMRQPDISTIEEGKKNVTLKTLSVLCEVLEIKVINL